MDPMRDQSLKEFLTSLQRFIDHRGRLERSSTLVELQGGLKGFYWKKRYMTF